MVLILKLPTFATLNPTNLWPQGQVSGFSFYMRLQYSSDTFSGSFEIFMSEFLFIFLILHDNMELFTLPHILAKSIPTSPQRYNFSTTPQNDNGRFNEFLYLANLRAKLLWYWARLRLTSRLRFIDLAVRHGTEVQWHRCGEGCVAIFADGYGHCLCHCVMLPTVI